MERLKSQNVDSPPTHVKEATHENRGGPFGATLNALIDRIGQKPTLSESLR
jgi:hypothetical protein